MIRASVHGAFAALSVVLAIHDVFELAIVIVTTNCIACYAFPWDKQ